MKAVSRFQRKSNVSKQNEPRETLFQEKNHLRWVKCRFLLFGGLKDQILVAQ